MKWIQGLSDDARGGRGMHCKGVVVRVSLGVASTFKDVYQFVDFARSFTDLDAPLDKRAAFTSGLAVSKAEVSVTPAAITP
jgi:hypothetical protein